MARVTVEDCLKKINNRFDLVLISTRRARELATGGKEPYLDWENDKPPVVALREIAEGYIDRSILNPKRKKVRPVATETSLESEDLASITPPPPPVEGNQDAEQPDQNELLALLSMELAKSKESSENEQDSLASEAATEAPHADPEASSISAELEAPESAESQSETATDTPAEPEAEAADADADQPNDEP